MGMEKLPLVYATYLFAIYILTFAGVLLEFAPRKLPDIPCGVENESINQIELQKLI